MKRFLFLLSLFTSYLTSYSQTNIYHPLPDSGYYWNIIDLEVTCSVGGADTFAASFYYFTIFGDTMVEGKKYRKVYLTNALRDDFNLRGFFYEDSINRKVYLVTDDPLEIDHPITADTLLYDFNIELGSTVDDFYEFRFFPDDHPANSIVIGIDSINIEGSYRRRIAIQYELFQCESEPTISIDTLYWIEGIGSTIGFSLRYRTPLLIGGDLAADVLTCVYNNNIEIFTNEHLWHSCDSIFLELFDGGNISNTILSNTFSIYPQPANTYFNLENHLEQFKNGMYVEIFDITGKIILKQLLQNNKFNSIHTEHFSSGIYLIKIHNSNELIFSDMLIVQL